MEKEIKEVQCKSVPVAIGSYSQAICVGDLVFVSGQIPIIPETGEILSESIQEQTSLVIDNTKKILDECGLGLDRIVKTDIFLSDIEDFSKVNEVYAEKFTQQPRPARCVIQVAALPKGVGIELSCIAYNKESRRDQQIKEKEQSSGGGR